MKLQVLKNAKRNMLSGVVNKLFLFLMPFIERTVMRYVLGSLYLGLNSLFTSILSVLSLAELGFSAAIVYNMYKPIAENDTESVNALLNLYKKVYRIIGCVVLGLGLLLIPFLPKLITGSYPDGINIYIVYLIFLINSSLSYFLYSYMNSLLSAHQREDVYNIINTVILVGMYFAKIIIVLIFKSYYAAIIMMPVFTVIQNLIIARISRRIFPQYKCAGTIPNEMVAPIKRLVIGTFISRACAVTRNSLDSICISAFLGLSLTAIYNNYYMISHGVTMFLGVVTTSLIGGIGNHVVTKSVDENYFELQRINFLYMLISGWCLVFLVCLYQPFMKLWMGKDMLLPMFSVILMGVYFYTLKIGDVLTMYSSTNGLWWQHKYRSLVETIMNLILNVVLGKYFGVNGIILATVISLFFCNFIWGSHITFGLYFKEKKYIQLYYIEHLRYAIVNGVILTTALVACSFIPDNNHVLKLIISFLSCFLIPLFLYYVIYRKNIHFIYAKQRILKR